MQTFEYLEKTVHVPESIQGWSEQHSLYMEQNKFYEDEFLNYTRDLNLPGTYLDIGSCLGNHTLFWSLFSKADRVISFEPLPRFCKVWLENMIANQVMDKVQLIPTALSDVENYQKIQFFDSITPTYTQRLDDLNLGPVSLIKIDIEGMEPQALRGGLELLKRHRPRIFAEAITKDDIGRIMSVLEPIGYELTGKAFNATPTYEIVSHGN